MSIGNSRAVNHGPKTGFRQCVFCLFLWFWGEKVIRAWESDIKVKCEFILARNLLKCLLLHLQQIYHTETMHLDVFCVNFIRQNAITFITEAFYLFAVFGYYHLFVCVTVTFFLGIPLPSLHGRSLFFILFASKLFACIFSVELL